MTNGRTTGPVGFEEFDANTAAVADALKMPKAKNFAPPTAASIRELIEELEESVAQVTVRIGNIKARLEHFHRLQADFYTGQEK